MALAWLDLELSFAGTDLIKRELLKNVKFVLLL